MKHGPAATLLLAILVACGGSTDAENATKNREEACRVSAEALCARVAQCSPLYIRFFFETVPDCEAMVNDACLARYSGAGATSSPRACPSEAATSPCGAIADPRRAVFFTTPPRAVLELCPVTPGALEDRAPCQHDGDCKSGGCGAVIPFGTGCKTKDEVDASFSAPNEMLTEGQPCDATAARPGGCDLTQGLVCADDGVCRALTIVGPGEACEPTPFDVPKSTAHLCDARAHCSAGTCAAAPKRGEPCTDTCRIGLSCVSGRCVTSN